MSKTYRSWAEIEDWARGRAFRRPHKRKSQAEAKKEIRRELETMSVFIIINEWQPVDGDIPAQEIVDGCYYKHESAAWEELQLVAADFDVELKRDETGFNVPVPEKGIEYEFFTIMELVQND